MSLEKRKNLSPLRELSSQPPEHWAGALSTELQELMESKVICYLNSWVCTAFQILTERICFYNHHSFLV